MLPSMATPSDKGNDIEKEEVGGFGRCGLAGQDSGLDSSAIGNSLIRVDALCDVSYVTIDTTEDQYLLELLAIEEVAQQLLDARNTCRTTNKDNLVNL